MSDFLELSKIAVPHVCNTASLVYKKITKGVFNPEKDIPDLDGKVIFITGGNGGLGKESVLQLAKHNPAHIYLAARTVSKADEAIKDIKAAVPNARITHLTLDLMSFESIHQAAEAFHKSETQLDLLINNAGIMATPFELTKDGYESQFGTNHMGHFLLTKLLLPALLKTAEKPGSDVRIINISSVGHAMAPKEGIIFDQAQLEKTTTWLRYGQSKLANILFAKELAKRYPSITSVSIHPGMINTELYGPTMDKNVLLKWGLQLTGGLAMVDVKEGARNQLWAATAAKGKGGVESGNYYIPVGTLGGENAHHTNEKLAEDLWSWSESEVKRHGYF